MLTPEQSLRLRALIGNKLVEIEDILGPEYRLTLIARHATKPTAHIVFSVETNDDARRALDEIERDPGAVTIEGRR